MNFLIDAAVMPLLSAGIEVALWAGILAGMGTETLGGFGRESYLAYALWATFVGRITANWMFEYTMLDEIDSGRVNAILVRPISFYEFYLSQFLGYKGLVSLSSLGIPLGISLATGAPTHLERLPLMILALGFYLVFTHTLSFCVACLAFFLNRAFSLTGIKNLAIMVLAGELLPLDLYPEPLRAWMVHSPFASGVYIPVGYITGRINHELFLQSLLSVTAGIAAAGVLGALLWRRGLQAYSGTGA